MNRYPADERQIREVERGERCEAIVAMPVDGLLAEGDTVLFSLAHSEPGQEPRYVKDGDSIRVSLIRITDVGEVDVLTGHPLVQLAWKPLGSEPVSNLLAYRI